MGGIQHSTLLLAEYLILKERYEIELLLPNSGPLSRILSNKSIPIKVYNSIKYKSTAISFLNDQFRIPNPFSWCWNLVAIGLNILRIRENINPNTDLVVSKGLLNHFTSVIASKLLKIPVLIHLQDLITGRYFGIMPFIFKYFAKIGPDYIVCDGNLIQHSLGKNIKNKSSVILNGINTDHFNQNKKLRLDIRTEFNLPDEAYVIGHIARITPWKGQSQLIKAFYQYSKTNQNTYLILIGSPLFDNDKYFKSVKKMVQDLSLSGKVIMPGYRNDLQALFSAMDLFLYPSLNKDTSPLALLSGLSAGLPVGVSNIESLKEIINICPGVDVFNPTHLNEIVNIMEKYEDPDSRNRNRKLNKASGRKHFGISIHGKKMEHIIQHVYRSNL